MKLRRIRLAQFRQFMEAVEFDALQDGLNLFCGPNEAGKSTLVCAIRAAFFERHRSSAASSYMPWGNSAASPLVELDFEHDGETWQLSKSFMRQKRCDLRLNGRHFSGDEAEEQLAGFLGFQLASRGASKAEHQGIPGLLWIEQGQGQEVREGVQYASEHLKQALGSSMGELASSSGDSIISAVETLRAENLTRTGRETGDLAAAMETQTQLCGQLQELDEKIADYRGRVDRLAEKRAEQAEDEARRPWESLRRSQQQAQQRLEQISGLGEQQEADQRQLEACRLQISMASDQLKMFQQQAEDLRQRQLAHEQAQRHCQQLQADGPPLRQALQAARQSYQQARESQQLALQQQQRRKLQDDYARDQSDLKKRRTALDEARRIQSELLDLQRELMTCRIDAADVERLKVLDREIRELQVRQEGVATRLRFTLEPDKSLLLDGTALTGNGERLLLSEAELLVEGVGRLQIVPGGQDLGELVRSLERRQEQQAALLAEMQVASASEAEQRLDTMSRTRTSISAQQRLLASHAPQGLDVLQAEQQQLQQRVDDLQAQLRQLPPEQDGSTSLESMDQQLQEAEARLASAEARTAEWERQWALAEQARTSAEAEWQKLQAQLDPQRSELEQKYGQQLAELRARESSILRAMDERQQRITEARPDILKQDIQRLASSAQESEKRFQTRRELLARAEAELETLGAHGLEEERAAVSLQLQACQRRVSELSRHGRAADLLLGLLREKRQQLTRQLQAPLQKHLNHYLQLIFDSASLEVDEDLMPTRLSRDAPFAGSGDFDTLSFGAREQMGLISRLAYADLLKEVGRPTLIILDDALVHSDEQRLGQMKRILFDAAQRHQILLFSCHPRKWEDMGVAIRDVPPV